MQTIGIFIYPNAEVLDFSGPFEVFSTANRLTPTPVFKVLLIAEQAGPLLARGGFSVTPHCAITNHPPLDLLLLVGGDHSEVITRRPVLDWVAEQGAKVAYRSSVCTGVFLWAEAGVLSSETVTTHHQDIDDLRNHYPGLTVIGNRRWVEQGDFISSAGISAGIDMSLYWLQRLHGRELAEATARQMEFDWQSDPLGR
ncbi:DJ-1/PfpI family protein [Halioxenophilus sp. WMMB6]|uniref:DJ-1/PfpI family protein n=1 Tax=Halioxenophilus sp. WMMB6 TaxID=3073815 RepID=UPI00295E8479|nr:DJ-1/PfpI family protein [Halioxenophilus sp. WMMB6]